MPPVVWDGVEGCEHEWGDETLITTGRNDGDNEREGRGIGGVRVPKQTGSQGQFCRKCGAWLGCLGLDPTPELFVKHIVDIFREVKRVLRDDGTIWVNLGDSYAGGASGTNPSSTSKLGSGPGGASRHRDEVKFAFRPPAPGLKPKDLCGIPWRVAFALQADGWYLRSDIIWHKPNPMPESVTDRPTKSHEYIFLLSKRPKYFYDAESIKEESIDKESFTGRRARNQGNMNLVDPDNYKFHGSVSEDGKLRHGQTYPTRNKRTVWTVATAPYKEAHFATFPPKLIEPCLFAGTSEKGCCVECGAPWERVVESEPKPRGRSDASVYTGQAYNTPQSVVWGKKRNLGGDGLESKTTGWKPTCSCNAETTPCTVLEPFGGAGTTPWLAEKYGRKWVAIEMSEEYCKLIVNRIDKERKQLKMF